VSGSSLWLLPHSITHPHTQSCIHTQPHTCTTALTHPAVSQSRIHMFPVSPSSGMYARVLSLSLSRACSLSSPLVHVRALSRTLSVNALLSLSLSLNLSLSLSLIPSLSLPPHDISYARSKRTSCANSKPYCCQSRQSSQRIKINSRRIKINSQRTPQRRSSVRCADLS